MIYRINICEYCGLACRLANPDDVFCPFCGAEIKLTDSIGNVELAKKLKEKQAEIDALERKIQNIQTKAKQSTNEIISKANKTAEENEALKAKNKELSDKIEKLNKINEAKKEDSTEKLITSGKSNTDIYLQFINISDKKNNPLPVNFKKAYLDLSGSYILNGVKGTDTAVYMCPQKNNTLEVFPNELIISPIMRDYYHILFELKNKDGKNIKTIEPCILNTSNTGYFDMTQKGSIIFE